ncbi:unnamed protein product [Rotaria socialis]|uniref:Major facilitator superfamily (MFS) profile domain-containing protein n=1 Tax=Rotaria socialis TaxID=392032 RepID=A0A821WGC9_9BILA|nr:unnamed protein product [Rotaria socialis]CAF4925491.1 unnamed protein product [Rotaria socialis]
METSLNDSLTLNSSSLPTTLEKPATVVIPDTSISIYEIRSNRRRLFILIILAFSGLLLPFSDSVYLPSLANIEHDLHASTTLVDYTVSTYLICAGIFSLLWGPLSDQFGRKIILLLSFIIFLGFTIVCILARSIIVLLIFRSLQGAAISASLVVGQSAIVDMYQPDTLGFAMGLFLVPFLIGPILGPFIGGILSNTFGWRSTFISLAIMSVISALLILIFVPETHHYRVLQQLSRDVKKKCKHGNQTNTVIVREAHIILKPRFVSPWYPFLALSDMTIAPHVAVCNMNFTALFISLTLMSNRESQEPYTLSSLHIGFSYIPTGVLALLGSLTGGWISDWSAKHFSQAMEGRLILNLIGTLMCPIGLLLYGWTFHFGIHLALPLIGSTLFSFGESFMYSSTCAFVNIKKPAMAGSLLALINAISFVCAGIGIIVAIPLVTLVGFGPLFSLVAGLSFLLICISLIIVIYQLRSSKLSLVCPNELLKATSLGICTAQSEDIISVQWF